MYQNGLYWNEKRGRSLFFWFLHTSMEAYRKIIGAGNETRIWRPSYWNLWGFFSCQSRKRLNSGLVFRVYQEQKRSESTPRYWILPITNRTNDHQASGVIRYADSEVLIRLNPAHRKRLAIPPCAITRRNHMQPASAYRRA
jgi:hypothetical protein